MDTKVFDAYNRCDLDTFAASFDRTVSFYHDTGGATFDRDTVAANTRKYICGKVKRALVPTSFHVYPIKGYGAIEEVEHRFCEFATGRCECIAKFVIVWKKAGDAWRITKVLSYGHRLATPPSKVIRSHSLFQVVALDVGARRPRKRRSDCLSARRLQPSGQKS